MERTEYGRVETDRVRVSGIDIEWDTLVGTCRFGNLPVAMMWVDTTLTGLMSGVQAMVGTERFFLALQSEGARASMRTGRSSRSSRISAMDSRP